MQDNPPYEPPDTTRLPADPDLLKAALQRLAQPSEFWKLIAAWVSPTDLARRQTYYRGRFARDRIPPDAQLFWLTNEFQADILCREAACGSPITNRVELDEALAKIKSLDDWLGDLPLAPATRTLFIDLTEMGISPPAFSLERMKDHARHSLIADYQLPVLPPS